MTTPTVQFISGPWESPSLRPPGTPNSSGQIFRYPLPPAVPSPNTWTHARPTSNAIPTPVTFTIPWDQRFILNSTFIPDTQAVGYANGQAINPIGPIIYYAAVTITTNGASLPFTVYLGNGSTGAISDLCHACGGWLWNAGVRYAQIPRKLITWNGTWS